MRIYVFILSLCLLAVGCAEVPGVERDPRVWALSRDGKVSFQLDRDAEVVLVHDAASGGEVSRIPVGRAPERLQLGSDGTLYVVNRGSRSVSLIRPGQWSEALRIPVGIEPIAVAVSRDNRLLYVLNASTLEAPERGSLSVVELAAGKVAWEVALEGDPRALALEENLARVKLRGDRELLVDLARRVVFEQPAQPDPAKGKPQPGT